LSAKAFIVVELVVLKHEFFNEVNEPKLNTLNVYEDENGILRLKSPIINREDTRDFRCPIILDPKHPLTRQLIE